MSQRSPVQRFIHELRRRHVPQTAAIYLVAGWAAIQFADVVAPNLGWPQGVVTAVIIAAAVGFPAVLVLAWFFDLGPEGIHRTGDEPARTGPGSPSAPGTAAAGGRSGAPWVAAVAILVVAIGSAVAMALLLSGNGGEEAPRHRLRLRPVRRAAHRRARRQANVRRSSDPPRPT